MDDIPVKTYSIIRLNQWSDASWGVVEDQSGALVHIDGLAIRLTQDQAQSLADDLNSGARRPVA